jgi:hypothetical protein
MIDRVHDDIEHRWEAAYEQQRADEAAHKASLEAAKAERAAPGSVDDVKKAEAMWKVIRALANTALEACDKAAEEQEARAAEGAAEGVALPPGAGMR